MEWGPLCRNFSSSASDLRSKQEHMLSNGNATPSLDMERSRKREKTAFPPELSRLLLLLLLLLSTFCWQWLTFIEQLLHTKHYVILFKQTILSSLQLYKMYQI